MSGAATIARRTSSQLLAPVTGVVVFFGLWELAVRVFRVKAFIMPGPFRIVREMLKEPSFFLGQARTTAWAAVLGLLVAIVIATALAIPMSRSTFFERAMGPVVTWIVVIPLVCYAPAFVIWMKPGLRPIVAVTAVVSFVPILFALVSGLRATDAATRDMLLSAGASRRDLLWQLELPTALPHLIAGLRTAVGLALIGAVLGEWSALVSRGLGVQIQRGVALNRAPLVWASAFTLGLMGLLALGTLTAIERRFRPHTSG